MRKILCNSWPAMALLVLFIGGCINTKSYSTNNGDNRTLPPPPTFDSLSVYSMGGKYSIRVPGIEVYIMTYGKNGWFVGLCDSRPATQAVGIRSQQESIRQKGEENSQLRVKDIFYAYYQSLQTGASSIVLSVHLTPSERDSLIKETMAQIAVKRDEGNN